MTEDLDNYESEIENALSNNSIKKADKFAHELNASYEAAESYTKKSERISLRLTPTDLKAIKTTAIEEGIPYQTLISGVLHKFVTGKLVDSKHNSSDNM